MHLLRLLTRHSLPSLLGTHHITTKASKKALSACGVQIASRTHKKKKETAKKKKLRAFFASSKMKTTEKNIITVTIISKFALQACAPQMHEKHATPEKREKKQASNPTRENLAF